MVILSWFIQEELMSSKGSFIVTREAGMSVSEWYDKRKTQLVIAGFEDGE